MIFFYKRDGKFRNLCNYCFFLFLIIFLRDLETRESPTSYLDSHHCCHNKVRLHRLPVILVSIDIKFELTHSASTEGSLVSCLLYHNSSQAHYKNGGVLCNSNICRGNSENSATIGNIVDIINLKLYLYTKSNYDIGFFFASVGKTWYCSSFKWVRFGQVIVFG